MNNTYILSFLNKDKSLFTQETKEVNFHELNELFKFSDDKHWEPITILYEDEYYRVLDPLLTNEVISKPFMSNDKIIYIEKKYDCYGVYDKKNKLVYTKAVKNRKDRKQFKKFIKKSEVSTENMQYVYFPPGLTEEVYLKISKLTQVLSNDNIPKNKKQELSIIFDKLQIKITLI